MAVIDDLGGGYALSPGQQGIARLVRTGLWDQVIDEVDGRRIRIGDRWLIDFASCNYLGLDLDPGIQAEIGAQVARWGVHPSWSRMLGSPRLYPLIEERMSDLLGVADTLLLPTISQIHLAVIPILARRGTILLDARAHRTVYDGCVFARGQGATLRRFRAGDVGHLRELLRGAPADRPVLVCVDGVNSMTGNASDVAAMATACREHDALLYIDDAHGFGVIGERRPDETTPYGARGNAIVRHVGETYDNIVLVGGFSKAYSAMLAFVACPPEVKRLLKVAAAPYLYSGPVPTAALATVLAGLEVNARRGDEIRATLYRGSRRVLDHLDSLGVATPNESGFPLIQVPLTDPEDLDRVGRALLDCGIYTTLAPYPGVPRSEVGFRVQVTAANTDEEIDELLDALTGISGALRRSI
jgi:8-amino-7-oxononanoate synthase